MIGDNIRYLRKSHGMSQDELAEKLGYKSFTTVQKWESNLSEPPLRTVHALAALFNVDIDDLSRKDLTAFASPGVTNDTVTFVIHGEVAAHYGHAGQPDVIQDSIDIPRQYLRGRPASDYYVLRVVGNSMHPDYMDGDVVLVLKTPTLRRSGQIGVVRHGDDATLKKVEYVVGEDWMRLIPLNREYPEQLVEGADLEEWRVEGIPRMVIRQLDD